MLKFKDVSSGYGRKPVVTGINLEIGQCSIIGIKGKNGSGKSTLLKAIVGQADIIKGEIQFRGKKINNLPTHKIIRLGINYVSQATGLFPDLTIEEHFDLICRKAGEERVNIYSDYRYLEKMKHKKAAFLSGGQQRILSIILMKMRRSKIFILDEPTAGLDLQSIQHVEKLLLELKKQYAIILVEQNQDILNKVCDEIYEIDDDGILLQMYSKNNSHAGSSENKD